MHTSVAQAPLQTDGNAESLIGTRLVDYLDQLRAEGLAVIYSSTLVPDSLLIASEPSGRSARRRLQSILTDLSLALERGPQDTWLIVRDETVPLVSEPVVQPATSEIAAPPLLENVIVTASRYAFARDPFASGGQLDRLQIEATPSIGDDALRPVANLPGVSGNGLSSRTTIRGGASDETQVMFDGIELLNPFHLKDFESVFGSISPRIVERMDIHTGGYASRYGNAMSGVIDISPIEPIERRHFEVGISTINTSFISSGRFANDRNSWLVSVRRGNIDLLLDAADSDFGRPQFTDFYSRVTSELGPRVNLRFGAISLNDKISLNDDDSNAAADYDDTYIWIGADQEISDSLNGTYVLALAGLDSFRSGSTEIRNVSAGRLIDRRSFNAATVRADWTYRPNDRHIIEWGLRARRSEADYDFAANLQLPVLVAGSLEHPGTGAFTARLERSDTFVSPYVDYRLRVNDALVVQLGARFDDRSAVNERSTSPRIGAAWDVTETLALRASWGQYRQSQELNELQLADRDVLVHPTQRAEHRIVSMEYKPSGRMSLRIEAFEKLISEPRVRFDNLFTRLSLIPELLPDRVRIDARRARATGFEAGMEVELTKWRWWFNYSRSEAKDLIAQAWIRRSWQESWSGKAGFIRSTDKWTVSAALTTRSGWPISTPVTDSGQLRVDAMNDTAFEKYRSLDFKATRLVSLDNGSLEVYVELINVLDDENPCCFEHTPLLDSAGALSGVTLDTQNWLPGIPVIGFRWGL